MSAINPNNKMTNPLQADELPSSKLNLFTQLETHHSSNNLQLDRRIIGQIQSIVYSLFKDFGKKYDADSYPPAKFVVAETAVKEPSKKELFFVEKHQQGIVREKSLKTRRSRVFWWM